MRRQQRRVLARAFLRARVLAPPPVSPLHVFLNPYVQQGSQFNTGERQLQSIDHRVSLRHYRRTIRAKGITRRFPKRFRGRHDGEYADSTIPSPWEVCGFCDQIAHLIALREVAPGKGAARSGFQIALESQRLLLGSKLDRHHQGPRSIGARIATRTCVVPNEPRCGITGDTDIVTDWICLATKNVNAASFCSSHDMTNSIDQADRRYGDFRAKDLPPIENLSSYGTTVGGICDWAGTAVRLRSLRELRRDRLRVMVTRRTASPPGLPRRSSAKPSEGWLGGRDSDGLIRVRLRWFADSR